MSGWGYNAGAQNNTQPAGQDPSQGSSYVYGSYAATAANNNYDPQSYQAVGQQEGSVGAYNYGAAQGAPADANKPSAAAQAIYSLPPAQQEKLSQIISQVNKGPATTFGNAAGGTGYQYSAQTKYNQHASSTPMDNYNQAQNPQGIPAQPNAANTPYAAAPPQSFNAQPAHSSYHQQYNAPPSGYSAQAPKGHQPGLQHAPDSSNPTASNRPGYAANASRYGMGPPSMGPPSSALPSAPLGSSMAPAGPKAGYGSGYSSGYARQGTQGYGQQGSGGNQPRLGMRGGHQGGSGHGPGSQGPSNAPSSHYGSRGGRGGHGSSGGRGSHQAGGRSGVVGQSASMWRDLVDGPSAKSRDRESRRDHTESRSALSPGGGSKQPESRHRGDGAGSSEAGHSRSRHKDNQSSKDAPREPHGSHSRSRDQGDEKRRAKSPRDREKDHARPLGRDQEAPKRESASHKSSASQPRAPEYSVKIASHPYGTHAKEYMDLSHRYSRLHVPTDFSKCLSLWTKAKGGGGSLGCSLIKLDNPAKFEFDIMSTASPSIETATPPTVLPVHNAKVAILCGLDDDARKDLLKDASSGGLHLHKLLKFLTVRCEKGDKRSGITLLGGPVDHNLDGRGEEGRVRACIRHAQQQVKLDLSSCANWTRFAEIYYQRPCLDDRPGCKETQEITTIFLIDAAECMPSASTWPDVWKEQESWKQDRKQAATDAPKTDTQASSEAKKDPGVKEPEEAMDSQAGVKEEAATQLPSPVQQDGQTAPLDHNTESKADKPKEAEAPWPPSLLIRGCMYDTGERWRSACISLDGLLDYDEEDKEEGAFEINLFAENFSELLARDYGRTILTSLYAAREALRRQRQEEAKRKREDDVPVATEPVVDGEPDPKRQETEADAEDIRRQDQDETKLEPEAEPKQEPEAELQAKPEPLETSAQEQPHGKTTAGKGRGAGGRGRGRGRGKGRGRKSSVPADVKSKDTEQEPETDKAETTPHEETEEKPAIVGKGEVAENTKQTSKSEKGSHADTDFDVYESEEVTEELLLLAYRYFDKTGTGYLRVEDVRRICHNLGLGLSHRTVKELCKTAGNISGDRLEKISYKDLHQKIV